MAGRPCVTTGLDRIVRLAGQFFEVPVCAISSTGLNPAWAKSDQQVCLNDIQEAAAAWSESVAGLDPLIVPDASRDERFAALARASALPGIRFYAGMPLLSCGVRIGTLAILDTRPHAPLDAGQLAALRDFACLACQEIERRGSTTDDWLPLARQAAEIGFWDWDVVDDNITGSDQLFRL